MSAQVSAEDKIVEQLEKVEIESPPAVEPAPEKEATVEVAEVAPAEPEKLEEAKETAVEVVEVAPAEPVKKASKMGGLLMKAHKDGELESKVEAAEAATEEPAAVAETVTKD
tara:strand:- start:1133 stop:1468 length:336 start_codon:yes stop_codon:yes gene_type:complete